MASPERLRHFALERSNSANRSPGKCRPLHKIVTTIRPRAPLGTPITGTGVLSVKPSQHEVARMLPPPPRPAYNGLDPRGALAGARNPRKTGRKRIEFKEEPGSR